MDESRRRGIGEGEAMNRIFRTITVMAALALAGSLTACGSDSDTSSEDEMTTGSQEDVDIDDDAEDGQSGDDMDADDTDANDAMDDDDEEMAEGMCSRWPLEQVKAIIEENLGSVPDDFNAVVDDDVRCRYFSGDYDDMKPEDVTVSFSLLNRTPEDDDVCPEGDQFMDIDGIGDFACGVAYGGKGQLKLTFASGQEVYDVNMSNDVSTMFLGDEALVAQHYTPEAWETMRQLGELVIAEN